MDRFTALLIAGLVATLIIAGFIVYSFGIVTLIRVILFLGYATLAVVSVFFLAILVYAKSKYLLPAFLSLVASGYAAYQCYVWNRPVHVAYITAAYIFVIVLGLWWISEPDLSFYERLRSAEALEKSGRYRAAARKFEKKKDYVKAAECYLKAGLKESAAWCYEKAEQYSKAAEIYEELAEEKEEAYYWKEAYEMYKKAGEMLRAAKCLERYAEDEPWFWEDVAKIYEDSGDAENAVRAWKRALDYYITEAEEEGVFWEDVAKIYEKLGEKEKAREAMLKFAGYCEKEAESDPAWWKHVGEAYEALGDGERTKQAFEKYEEYRQKGHGS